MNVFYLSDRYQWVKVFDKKFKIFSALSRSTRGGNLLSLLFPLFISSVFCATVVFSVLPMTSNYKRKYALLKITLSFKQTLFLLFHDLIHWDYHSISLNVRYLLLAGFNLNYCFSIVWGIEIYYALLVCN